MKYLVLILTMIFVGHGAFAQIPDPTVEAFKKEAESKYMERKDLELLLPLTGVSGMPNNTVFKIDKSKHIIISARSRSTLQKCVKEFCCTIDRAEKDPNIGDTVRIKGDQIVTDVVVDQKDKIVSIKFEGKSKFHFNCRQNDKQIWYTNLIEFVDYLKKEWGIEAKIPLPKEVKRKVPEDSPGVAPEVAI